MSPFTHVAVRRPHEGATKIWLTADGGCLLASDDGSIPKKQLSNVLEFVTNQHEEICQKWVEKFGNDSLKFYE